MSAPVRLTPARRRALLVLLGGHKVGRTVAVSNRTSDRATELAGRLTVYWQTVRWLVDEGLALEHATGVVELTPAGLERARATAAAAAGGGAA